MRLTESDARSLAQMPVIQEPDPEGFYNPSQALQEQYVGISFDAAYEQASRFLNYSFEHCDGEPPTRLLDFGCGWGRMLKLLRKMPEFAETELHGCDVSPDALEAVRRTSPRVWVTPCDPFPPSRYASSCFGRVLAFSVFSHLAESAHLAWAAEFARIVHPGGHAVITVQGDKYLDLCEDYRSGAKPITHPWHQDLANSFAEPDARARFDAGEFLFKERRLHPDGAAPTYGEAVVPRSYIEARWGDAGFDLIDWNDRWGQNWCVLRRR